MKIKLFFKKNKSFTIIETAIAIFIIIVGIVLISLSLSKTGPAVGLSSLYYEAANLTQEGIELVRNKRDTNWLTGANWNNGLSSVSGLVPSPFTRTISVSFPESNKALVTSEVEFNFRGKIYKVSAQEYLCNWLKK